MTYSFLNNFENIYQKEISLHKNINDSDIRVIFVDGWNQLYIIDANDIEIQSSRLFLDCNNIPKTCYSSPIIRFRSWSKDILVYPYLEYKTTEQMACEPIKSIKNKNSFLIRENEVNSATIITILEKENERYYIRFYFNKKTIDRILEMKREPKYNMFLEMISLKIHEEILENSNKEIQSLLLPSESKLFQNEDKKFVINKNVLKNTIKLFNYQINDIQWMENIEQQIKLNTNQINFKISQIKSIYNEKLMYFNSSILPNIKNNSDLYTNKNIKYYGGNLISEVGLGKTIISLYHCLNSSEENRKIYNNLVDFESKCNYMYKRGNKKGFSCGDNCVEESLFCKNHKNSLFIDKRVLKYKHLYNFDTNNFITDSNLIKTNSCLIICPNQLCDQWVKEYYDKFINNKRVLLIVTKDQFDNITLGDILFSDLVIISYNFLLNNTYKESLYKVKSKLYVQENFNIPNKEQLNIVEYSSKVKELLNSKKCINLKLFHWNKILLDEAHEIQNMKRGSLLQEIISDLSYTSKWNLSGTPFANSLESYLHLMSYNTSFQPYDEINSSYNLMNVNDLLTVGLNSNLISHSKPLFKRNTKMSISKEYGENIINEKLHKLEFTDQERNIYNSYLQGQQTKYIDILIKLCCHCELFEGTKTLIKNCKTLDEIQKVMLDYNKEKMRILSNNINVLQKNIMDMENELQITLKNYNGLDTIDDIEYYKVIISNYKKSMTSKKKEYNNIERIYNYLNDTLKNIKTTDMCPICLDNIENITITKCGHKFCWECIYDTYEVKKSYCKLFKCPTCNQEMEFNEIYSLAENINDNNSQEELNTIVKKVKSTKIGNIIHYIKNVQENDKIILFSQWDELIHKVGKLLNDCNINIVYCNGSIYQRKRAIEIFRTDKNINVILLSSRNAASGINLTAANKIILLEPIYGAEEYRKNIESQAIGRADRIGQNRPIEVHKFIINDTIEEDIINNNIDDIKIKQMTL